MSAIRSAVIVGVAFAIIGVTAERASAEQPGRCVEYSPLGFCVEWDVPGTGTPAQPVRSGGEQPTCYWVTIDENLAEDPTIWVDFGLAYPPEGVEIAWQSWECSDGSTTFDFRWIIPSTPGNLAASVRGRIIGLLPQPTVASSPPIGVAAIVGVPVFVEVSNWTGVVTEQECAGGLCVTVTATPALRFDPGEQSSAAVACAGRGSRYQSGGESLEAQASAPGACTHTYRLRSGAFDRPAVWEGSVSVTWAIAWTASSGATGSLPAVTRSTDLPRAVGEVQAVVVGGRTP